MNHDRRTFMVLLGALLAGCAGSQPTEEDTTMDIDVEQETVDIGQDDEATITSVADRDFDNDGGREATWTFYIVNTGDELEIVS